MPWPSSSWSAAARFASTDRRLSVSGWTKASPSSSPAFPGTRFLACTVPTTCIRLSTMRWSRRSQFSCPRSIAARYLSVFAGTATLAVLYLLVVRLAGRPAALVACLVAAVSPLARVVLAGESPVCGDGPRGQHQRISPSPPSTNARGARWAVALRRRAGECRLPRLQRPVRPRATTRAPALRRVPAIGERAIPIVVAGVAAVVAYLPWLSERPRHHPQRWGTNVPVTWTRAQPR